MIEDYLTVPSSLALLLVSFVVTLFVIENGRKYGKSVGAASSSSSRSWSFQKIVDHIIPVIPFSWTRQGGPRFLTILELCQKVAKKGPVFFYQNKWFNLRLLVINDLPLAKELFRGPLFSDRPSNELWRYHFQENHGIVMSSGKVFTDQKRFAISKLKDVLGHEREICGQGSEIRDEFLQFLDQQKGQPIEGHNLFILPLLDMLWVTLTGQRYTAGVSKKEADEINQFTLRQYEGFCHAYGFPDLVLFGMVNLPLSKEKLLQVLKWLPIFPGVKTYLETFQIFKDRLETLVRDRQKKFQMNRLQDHDSELLAPQNFLDAYLQEIEKSGGDQNSTFFKEDGVQNLVATLADFFVGGVDAPATMLSWCMLHLIRNPDIQTQIRDEIDRVIGRERRPTLQDRPNCPFTEAFILEVCRMDPSTSISLPHVATQDVQIGQLLVPTGTIAVMNITGIQYDAQYWDDPQVFRPARFLSADGQTLVKKEAMIIFSYGARKCPGHIAALDHLFCFVGSICQKFVVSSSSISTKNGCRKTTVRPPLDAEFSLIHSPKKFYMTLNHRERERDTSL